MSLQFVGWWIISIICCVGSITAGYAGYQQFQEDFKIAVERLTPKSVIAGDVTIKRNKDEEITLGNLDIRGSINIVDANTKIKGKVK